MKKCMLMLFFVAAQVTLMAGDVDKHLLLYSRFDGNNQLSVGSAENGVGIKTEKGGYEYVQGKYGKAISFLDGAKLKTDLVYKMGKALEGKDWTIAMWVMTEVQPNASRGTLFRTYTSGGWGDGDIFSSFGKWGKMSFVRFDANRKYCTVTVSSNAIQTAKWTHLAFVSKGNQSQVFINGTEAKYMSSKGVDAPAKVQKFIRVGDNHGQKSMFKGAIDELKIYNKALDAKELQQSMKATPLKKNSKNDVEPFFYAPFENNAEVIAGSDNVVTNSNLIKYKNSVVGRGVVLRRVGYDAKTTLSYQRVTKLFSNDLSLSFFFTPEWNGDHKGVHGLLGATCELDSWEISATDGRLNFTVMSGIQKHTVSTTIKNWKKDQPVYIAAGYSLDKHFIWLAIDGAKAVKNQLPADFKFATLPQKAAFLRLGDTLKTAQYLKTQANGVLDEVRLFDFPLTQKQQLVEIDRKNTYTVASAMQGTVEEVPVKEQEKPLWKTSDIIQNISATRQRVFLNALWRFQLTKSFSQKPDVNNWHYLAVPGRYSGDGNGRSDHQFWIRDKNLKPIEANGKQLKWDGKVTRQYRSAWFQRAFKAQPEWKNRTITLFIDELGADSSGILYLNGKKFAELNDKTQYIINIPADKLLYDGKDNYMTIHAYDRGNVWAWRGIKGDVYLDISDDIAITLPAVRTSVRKKTIEVEMTLENSSDKPIQVTPECQLVGENAPPVLKGDLVTVESGKSKVVTLKAEWQNPELWDYNNPYLYKCKLTLTDTTGKLLDEYPVFKIGFREFYVKGKDYYLNGKKIHLRNASSWYVSTSDYEWCKTYVNYLKSLGYNSIRMPFTEKDIYYKNMYKACDEEGMLLFGRIGGVGRSEHALWNDPEVRKATFSKMKTKVDAIRNHPSIVMWYLSVNVLGYGWDYHPLKMADGYLPDFRKDLAKSCREGAEQLLKYDPTRPYFLQAGGAFGPIINNNAYFNWWPEAEKIAWAEEWKKVGTKPLHIIETSFPYFRGLYGMDLKYPTGKNLFLIENIARYDGPAAYENVNKKLFPYFKDNDKRGVGSVIWQGCRMMREGYDEILKLKGDMLVPTVQAWRGSGMSGICPFAELGYAHYRRSPHNDIHQAYMERRKITDFRKEGWQPDMWKVAAHQDIDITRPNRYLQSIKDALKPVLIYIGGEKANPTSKSHNYFGGSKIEKTLFIINDLLKDQKFELTWKLIDANKNVMQQGSYSNIVAPAEIVELPMAMVAPTVAEPTEYQLVVEVTSPADTTVEPFAIKVFPQLSADIKTAQKVALYDNVGQTAKAFSELGIQFEKLEELSDLSGYGVVVVGRESLDPQFATYAKKLDLPAKVNAGQVNVAIFEQKPKALELLGLEAKAIYARRTFVSGAKTAVLKGLEGNDFSWWQGRGTLVPEFQEPDPNAQEKVASPLWHWSNLNMVCTYPIVRPNSGAARLLLVTGKDLKYSPLFELNAGHGKILFCQLEVSDRVKTEPAAAMIMSNIVKTLAEKDALKPFKPLFYLKSAAGDKLVAELGFEATAIESLQNATVPGIVLVTKDLSAQDVSDVKALAEKGMDVVFMPLDEKQAAKWDMTLKTDTLDAFQLAGKGSAILAELGARDRFFRFAQSISVLSGNGVKPLVAPAFAVEKNIGKGQFIFIQLDPFGLDVNVARDLKIGVDSSCYWANFVVKERLIGFWNCLLKQLGAEGVSLAGRLSDMKLQGEEQDITGTWKFIQDPKDIGKKEKWFQPAVNRTLKGADIKVPGYWESQGFNNINPNYKAPTPHPKGYDGLVWYVLDVTLDKKLQGKDLVLDVDAIDDLDWAYVNGVQVGHTGKDTAGYWEADRRYVIPASLTKSGKLNIAIRVMDLRGDGGIQGHVKLVEKVDSGDMSPMPYYTADTPTYDTEMGHRW